MAELDTTKSVLKSLALPTNVDVKTDGKAITFAAGAADMGLGDYGIISVFSACDSEDSYRDLTSLRQYFIDPASGSGAYDVDNFYDQDKAEDMKFYSASQLSGLGGNTNFYIIDLNVAPTAFITSPASVSEDGAASFSLSLTLFNVSQASGTVSMSFASAQSTATNGVDVSVPTYSGSYSVVQSPAGSYTITLPSIDILKDQVAEGTETIAVTIRASGRLFDTGTDTKTVTIKLIDSGQTGTAGADTLTGTRFNDDISGFGGDDRLKGGLGDDNIDGGAGYDTAVFSGFYKHSSLTGSLSTGVSVVGPDGRDMVTNVEMFQFADGTHIYDVNAVGSQIIRMYDSVLGRSPDDAGLDFYLDQIQDRGGTLLGVANDLVGSAEFQAATGNLTNMQFVDYVYQHTLGRIADAGGKAYYAGQLDAGLSRGALLVDFSESSEHRALTQAKVSPGYFDTDDIYQAVALLYDGFAGRLPDAAGLSYYAERVKSGQLTLSQVTGDFAGSTEFQKAIVDKDNGQIVDFLYQNALHRAPDAGGRAFYVDQLSHGASAASVLQDLALSAEHYNLFSAHITHGIDVL